MDVNDNISDVHFVVTFLNFPLNSAELQCSSDSGCLLPGEGETYGGSTRGVKSAHLWVCAPSDRTTLQLVNAALLASTSFNSAQPCRESECLYGQLSPKKFNEVFFHSLWPLKAVTHETPQKSCGQGLNSLLQRHWEYFRHSLFCWLDQILCNYNIIYKDLI